MPLGCHIVAICLLLPLLVIVKPGAPTKQHLRDSADCCNALEAAGSMSDSSVTSATHPTSPISSIERGCVTN